MPMSIRGFRRAVPPWLKDMLRGRGPNYQVVHGNRPGRRSTTEETFGSLIDNRKQWLFDTLPRDAAEYHYDIFTKASQKMHARRLGLEAAHDYLVGVPLSEIFDYIRNEHLNRFVIKPNASRSGIGFHALVRVADSYRDLRTGGTTSLDALERQINRKYGHLVQPDGWALEELLQPCDGSLSLLQDYKFYCFGGTVEVALIKFPVPGKKMMRYESRYYTRDWQPVKVYPDGKIDEVVSVPASGARLIAVAEEAASKLCYPFMRVDLYDTTRGVVLGEFTPGTGRRHGFTPEWDERFRRRWHEAAKAIEEGIRSGKIQPLTRGRPS